MQSFFCSFRNEQERKLDVRFFRQNGRVLSVYGKTELKLTKPSLSPKTKLARRNIYIPTKDMKSPKCCNTSQPSVRMRSEGYSIVCVCVCVCVFVCPIEILRMAVLNIELSHVLCIKSNYLQNGCVFCRKTLSFLRYSQSCSYERFRLHGHAYFY